MRGAIKKVAQTLAEEAVEGFGLGGGDRSRRN